MGEQFIMNNNSLTLIEQPTFTKAYFSETNVTFQNGKMTTKTEIEKTTFTNHVNTTRFNFNHCRGSLVAEIFQLHRVDKQTKVAALAILSEN